MTTYYNIISMYTGRSKRNDLDYITVGARMRQDSRALRIRYKVNLRILLIPTLVHRIVIWIIIHCAFGYDSEKTIFEIIRNASQSNKN